MNYNLNPSASIGVTIGVFFIIITGTALLARLLNNRIKIENRRGELSQHAEKTLGPIAASLAFLIGFCITIAWGGISAGQVQVEAEATAAKQLVWALDMRTEEQARAGTDPRSVTVLASLLELLRVQDAEDRQALASTSILEVPSTVKMADLQRSLHGIILDPKTNPAQSSALQQASSEIASARGELHAISRRALPPLLKFLVLMNGLLLAAVMGMALSTTRRPVLLVAWSFVVCLSISIVFLLDHPLTGPLGVSTQPLVDVVTWINTIALAK